MLKLLIEKHAQIKIFNFIGKDNFYMSETQNEQKKNKRWWVWVLLIIILILLAFLLGRCSHEKDPGTPVYPTEQAPEIDKNAGVYVEPEITPTESVGVAIPGWGKLIIPANTTENIVVDFYNPEVNADKYYLAFEIRLPDNSEQGYEVLYTSGLIEPGLHIQNISLNRALEAGTYEAIIHVQPYRMESKAPTNNADLKTELIVQ